MTDDDEIEVFISAYAEISKDYISRFEFPNQECVQQYLKSVSEKAGAELISHCNDTKDRTFTVKGPWISVNRARSFLQNFLTTFDSGDLRNLEINEAEDDIRESKNYVQKHDISPQNNGGNEAVPKPIVMFDGLEKEDILENQYRQTPLKRIGKALKNAYSFSNKHPTSKNDKNSNSAIAEKVPKITLTKIKEDQVIQKDEDGQLPLEIADEDDDEEEIAEERNLSDADYGPTDVKMKKMHHRKSSATKKALRPQRKRVSLKKVALKKTVQTRSLKDRKEKFDPIKSKIEEPFVKFSKKVVKTEESEADSNIRVPSQVNKRSRKTNTQHKRLSDDDSVDYPCPECPYSAKKKSGLREHKRRLHRTKDFACDKCGKIFGFGKDLTRHKKSHEKPQNCCDICGKLYKGIRTLAEHRKTHDDGYEKPEFQCDLCDKSFSTKYVLAYHIKSDHLGMKRTYLCPTCGKSFSQKHSYLQHANVHLGIRPYKCELCDKTFAYEKSLKEHKFMHDNIRRFKCDLCDKSFRQTSALAIHARIHKEKKDYVCSSCGRGFSQKQALKRHERIHLGEKPFVCGLCNRNFTDASVLRRHMILIHKKEPKKWREDTVSHVKRAQYFIDVLNKNVEKETGDGEMLLEFEQNEKFVNDNENQAETEYDEKKGGAAMDDSPVTEEGISSQKQAFQPDTNYLLPLPLITPQNPVTVNNFMNPPFDPVAMFSQQITPGTYNQHFISHAGTLHTLETLQPQHQPQYYPANFNPEPTKQYEQNQSNPDI
ncbi:hypothetical protein SNE40_020918 [Patella caerulea]|uniref:C2H2-type domain-containing protein n=1 Tax=Patella caerulea TaxID=87958 RepID=A0AAN8G203_PATCE